MKKIALVIIISIVLSACTNNSSAGRILEANGFTDIKYTGHDWFGCSQDDFYHTGFIATGPTGKQIKGCVCEGLLLKNSTIRFK